MPDHNHDPLAWWREARFGLFIHWGIYSVPAGFWKGQPIPSLGEWIMHNAKIPLEEYAPLAQQFNPIKFNAEEWVSVAAKAGMKYLVITAKHHDGFAMFHSPSNPYNIVDATPYGHDVMKDLAEACARHGLRMCFYYSQDQDWVAEGASGHWEEVQDKGWHGHKPDPERFAAYLESKVKPQLRELLTQYGPIGLIWFDTPVAITKEQSQMLKEYVHSLQPDCLVSGRVGHELGDYGSLGDNMIPAGPVVGDWETPATLNDTWGFKSDDHNWKSVQDLLILLVDLTSKGVNYLLNVGPTSEGLIPRPSIDLLLAIGQWMDVNSEAIYGTQPNPWPFEFRWGRVTAKQNKLFLLFYEWPAMVLGRVHEDSNRPGGWAGQHELVGLRSRVKRAYLLADPGNALPFIQDGDHVTISLPGVAPDPLVSVVALDFVGDLDVDTSIYQQADGTVTLPGYLADMLKGPDSGMALSRNGMVSGWRDTASKLQWQFKLLAPGTFTVRVVLGSPYHRRPPDGGHVLRLTAGEATVSGAVTCDEQVQSPRAQYLPEYAGTLGQITLDTPGTVTVALEAEQIAGEAGITLAAVQLVPA
ncbi:alpha-L-fucosidase [bacterium]|nr:alpha-L-fucosidase [bacterium]